VSRRETWDDVTKCLKKHGRPALVKQLVARSSCASTNREHAVVDGGLYLYVEYKGQWKIAGAFFGRGTDYELLDFKPLTIARRPGIASTSGRPRRCTCSSTG